VIDGRQVSFRDLIASDDDHRTLCQWLWTVLLADGTRALTGAGRWDQACAHAEQHSGVGQRLLDGRQVAVLARCLAGDPASAIALLDQSALSEPWEQAVRACLSVLCLTIDARPTASAVAAMVQHYLGLKPALELVVFRARLGLTVIDLAGGITQPHAAQAAARLVHETVAAGNGYAARDVLAHEGCRALLAASEKRALSATVRYLGLERGAIPGNLMTDLLAAVKMSETTTARNLATPLPVPQPE